MITQQTRASLNARQRVHLIALPATMHARLSRALHGRCFDWMTKHDPSFLKYQRYRKLSTRAKLFKTVRRRTQWDWSGVNASFFTPRHIRLASHYNGRHRSFGRWQKGAEEHEEAQEWNESDGYELSAREKSWKQQMERMRQRVDSDPYEAVFGKRFEPFWGPLLPAWMRSEVWPAEATSSETKPDVAKPERKDADKPDLPTSYAYASSTSWDSRSNTTRKSEWDSISNETKHYEYDPITNRMIQTSAKHSLRANGTPAIDSPAESPIQQTDVPPNSASVEASVKAAQTLTSNVMPPAGKPSAAYEANNLQSDKLDSLTASDIRGSMGQARTTSNQTVVGESSPLERDLQQLKMEKESLLRSDRRSFHLADLTRRVQALDVKISAVEKKVNAAHTAIAPTKPDQPLQPAVDRMQSKPRQQIIEQQNHAAHESTGATTTNVPTSWSQQADMLQSDRIERTRGSAASADRLKLSKADEILQKEVDQQRDIFDLHEERHRTQAAVATAAAPSTADDLPKQPNEAQVVEARYKAKLSSLKQELDLAYKQSSRHADEFRDQIRQSEARNAENEEKYKSKLANLRHDLDTSFKQSSHHADDFRQQISQSGSAEASILRQARANERKYKAQITALKEELGLAYEQSSRHGEEFRRQIKALEAKLAQSTSAVDTVRDAVIAGKTATASDQEEHDRRLVKDIRAIYENEYGIIGHENRPVDTSLDRALDQYDGKQSYAFRADDLEQELSGKSGTVPSSGSNTSQLMDEYGYPVDHKAYQFKDDSLEHELAGSEKRSDPLSKLNENTDAYTYKSDNLEQQLATNPELADVKEKDYAYDFKRDDLEAELREPQLDHLVKNNKTGVYHFQDDGLEAELKRSEGQSTTKRTDDVYRFRDDSLESELKAREQEDPILDKDKASYQFESDNLEAELSQQHTQQATSAEPAGLDKKSYSFEKDNLEAELAAQTPDASTTRQNRATLRQRIAEDFKDVARMLTEVRSGQVSTSRRNPVDGMTSPAVGNYASPTGFVNHDPVIPFDRSIAPKIRREEPVFSGTQRVQSRHSWRGRRERHSRRRGGKRVLKTAAVAIVAAMAVVYYEGSTLEASQAALRQQVQQETWQQVARAYEQSGERGVVKAMNEMQSAATSNSVNNSGTGMFWR